MSCIKSGLTNFGHNALILSEYCFSYILVLIIYFFFNIPGKCAWDVKDEVKIEHNFRKKHQPDF